MSTENLSTLKFYLHSTPANLRFGKASQNRKIGKYADICSTEERSENIHELYKYIVMDTVD